MPKIRVTIVVAASGQISVHPDPVRISKANGDTVEWDCTDYDWAVNFPVSPFNSHTFGQPKGHPQDSGPAKQGANGRYHYIVRVRFSDADGEIKELDPDVVVDI